MNLKHLTDKTLLSDTKYLVSKERELLAKLLHHLKEIDRRKLYSDLGYSSLYDYCIRELGYSESSAQRRIESCRVLAEIPQIEKKIENGSLSLSNIAQASSFFRKNEINSPEDKKAVLEQLENLSKKEGEKMLFAISGEEPKVTTEIKKRTSESTTRLSVNFKDETLLKCDTLRGLIGKNLTFEELIEFMLEITILEVEKKKYKVLSFSKVSPPPAEVNRVIKAGTKGEVYRRDKKCTKCGSIFALEFDHQQPFALGGTSDKTNLRLLCRNCNQRARIKAKLTSRSFW